MSIKGGYQIVNFNNVNLVRSTSVHIPGIYDSIEGNYHKPILATGLTIDGKESVDRYMVGRPVSNGDYYLFSADAVTIVVKSDDTATLS